MRLLSSICYIFFMILTWIGHYNVKCKIFRVEDDQEKSVGIYGGEIVPQGEAKFMALMFYKTPEGKLLAGCSTEVIDELHVLTAAHCISFTLKSGAKKPSSMFLLFGGYNINQTIGNEKMIRNIENFRTWPKWSMNNIYRMDTSVPWNTLSNDDIGILTFDKPIDLQGNSDVSQISLAPSIEQDENFYAKLDMDDCWALGYGQEFRKAENTGRLKKIKLELANKTWPKRSKKLFLAFASQKLVPGTEDQIQRTMQGDSGGPIVCRLLEADKTNDLNQNDKYITIGVLAVKYIDPPHFSLYTPITYYRKWIEEKIQEEYSFKNRIKIFRIFLFLLLTLSIIYLIHSIVRYRRNMYPINKMLIEKQTIHTSGGSGQETTSTRTDSN